MAEGDNRSGGRREGRGRDDRGRSDRSSGSSSDRSSGGARSGGPRSGGSRPGGSRPGGSRSGDSRPDGPRSSGPRSNGPRREGDRPGASARDGQRPPRRDGEGPPRRDGERPPRREGERPPRRDGERPPRRDGERPPRRDGERPPRREGERPPRRDGERPPRRDGDREQRPERAPLTPEQLRFRELRSVRPEHEDPPIDDGVSWNDLAPPVRYELKSLSVDNAEFVGNHLAMAALLIDSDPELAHQHAVSAYRRGGRLGVVRETMGLTAYTKGDFALALREFQTYRRLTGSDEQLGMEVDCERGLGRPERAIELGRSIDRSKLSPTAAVQLAIALSGARLDQGKPLLALAELDIPQLTPDTVFEYSPALFDAYAEVLEELDRHDDAAPWRKRARIAQQALDEEYGTADETEEFDVITEYEDVPEQDGAEQDEAESDIPVDSDDSANREGTVEPLGAVNSENDGQP